LDGTKGGFEELFTGENSSWQVLSSGRSYEDVKALSFGQGCEGLRLVLKIVAVRRLFRYHVLDRAEKD